MPDDGAPRPQRADARRNRARVLDAAIEAFAAEGLSVPVHEIARRAGVGTGTVSRHFPTKESLFQAIVLARLEHLVERARELAAAEPPGDALFAFIRFMVAEGATNRGLADALAGAGFDVEQAAAGTGLDLTDALSDLLVPAQAAGTVRADVGAADVKALIEGCLARERGGADPAARDRMLAVTVRGLRS
ncbi:TetR/AcrR family transcriptional regulator [Jiangella alkaliphila]|uniref:DNA-binding transcriptional regulator, AcrR family n=1 Tax=Jiangella alkaliphila TaxID=419479 RepID=A0A1H2LUH0_9ACTN|nr:TetR/AcrR family transcriptional regulator [Jiangella alkaliphila]SDU84348.1 DNA-binding transcriptional regulator, AcrR family [Jiangella alkaliphila]